MNLKKKKKLIARVLGIGVNRVKLTQVNEIKEAITRQDVKSLKNSGIIMIKEIKGTRHIERRKRKEERSRKRKINERKKNYVKRVRKLRSYIKNLRKKRKLSEKEYYDLRRKIKSNLFKDFSQLVASIKQQEKEK